MYNMDISIFGYKLNLQVLILIGVVYLILVGHTLCGCSNYGLMEGFDDASGNLAQDASGNVPLPAGATKTKGTVQSKEGFVGANINYGQSTPFDLNSNVAINTSSWNAPDMTVVPGQPLSPGVKQFLAREPQPVPLPEGEMFMFANTKFAPEYCPNTYSTSSGCAAMTGAQYNYLITRGGNNVPYSEY
jgi:hypothetical protein